MIKTCEVKRVDQTAREMVAMKVAEKIVGSVNCKHGLFYVDNILKYMVQNNISIQY